MIRRPPRSTPLYSSAASDVYKRQHAYCRRLSVTARAEFAMQSTADWMVEMSTKFQAENDSVEHTITTMLLGSPGFARKTFIVIMVLGVAGILTNLVVLFGFWIAGRSKMNVSSGYIANHTTLEHETFETGIDDRYACAFPTNCVITRTKGRPVIKLLNIGFLRRFDPLIRHLNCFHP